MFQGRFKAILVDRDAHLLELARYVVLNPVRAGMVADAAEWPWSSHRVMLGQEAAPTWLDKDALLGQFGSKRGAAVSRYAEHVRAGMGLPSVWGGLKHQIYLGDDAFVAHMQRKAGHLQEALEIPRGQRRAPAKPLAHYVALNLPRGKAMARAYATGDYSLAEVARAFGVHYSTVSRAVKRSEGDGQR